MHKFSCTRASNLGSVLTERVLSYNSPTMSAAVDQRVSDEVEVLQAILMDDLIIKKVDNIPYAIETVVRPSTGDDVDQQYVCVTLEVILTPGYPDVSPDVTLRHPRGLDDQLLVTLNSQIKEKLVECIGGAVVFELIELIRENLTESNLPSERCAICLFDFVEGDVFIKTQCYHYFHSRCLGNHLVALKKNYQEELEKLPNWKRMEAPPYQQTCPVCRSVVSCDVDALKEAPPAIDSVSAPPFRLTAELQELQAKMAKLLAKQVAKGGVVGVGDTGPPPLTITTPSDFDEQASNSSQSLASPGAQAEGAGSPASPARTPASPARFRGVYRGFNRRAKPGRRGQTSR